MAKQPASSPDGSIVAAETHTEVVSANETGGDVTRGHTVVKVAEKKTFKPPEDPADDMPLPTDPKTVFLGGLFGLACMAVLYVASEVVLPLIMAIVLKLLLQPLVRMLERVHIPRAVGAVFAVFLVLSVFGGTISVVAGPAADWAGKLPEALPKLHDDLGFLQQPIDTVQGMMHQIDGFTGGGSGGSSPQAPAMKPSNLVGVIFRGTATATSGVFTTLLILFYLLVSGETFLRRAVEILPHFDDKRQAVELSMRIERDVSAYLLTVTCINVLVGVATGCVMWLCGVTNPVLWGVVAFVMNYVPILGPLFGIVVFLMAGVVSLGVSWWAVLPAGLYFGIHVIEGEIATPMLLARRFTINPVAVMLALIFWFWMWGVTGAILAVPLLAVTKIICDDVRPLRAFGHLLEG